MKANLKPDNERRNRCVAVMLTSDEKKILMQLAKKESRTVSQQIRLLIRHVWEPTMPSDARSRAAGDRCR